MTPVEDPQSPRWMQHAGRVMDRRQFLRWGSVMVLSTGLASMGCSSSTPLKIALQPWCGYQFLVLAQNQGWLSPERIALHPVALASDSITLIEQGQVDGAALTLDEVLRLRDRGIALTVVMVFDVSVGADVLLARPEIGNLMQLRGKRIGVEDSGLAKIMIAKLLAQAKLEPDALQLEIIGSDHVAAWQRGRLDAILTYEPELSRLQSEAGLVRLFDSHEAPQLIVDVLAVRSESLTRHDTALRELIAGHFRALEQWYANPIDTAHRLSMSLGIEPEQVKSLFKGLDMPDVLYNRQYLHPPAAQLQHSASEIADIFIRQGLMHHPFQGDRLFTADYLPGEL